MLVNKKLAGKEVATAYGHINFNENGESRDLTKEQEEKLGKLPNHKYVEENDTKDRTKSENKSKQQSKPKSTKKDTEESETKSESKSK